MKHLLIGLLFGAMLAPSTLVAQENPRLAQRTVVYWALQSSVVLIQMVPSTPPRENAFCGGVVISSDTILTAAHCIRNNRKFAVRSYSGETAIPLSIRACVECDLALVQLHKIFSDARPALLSLDIAWGDTVYLVGAPAGRRFRTSRGIISEIWAKDPFTNECEKGDLTGTREQQLFATDADTYFGNSGGGAFDDRANLIGILVRVDEHTDTCIYVGQHLTYGLVVGPLAIRAFLDAR